MSKQDQKLKVAPKPTALDADIFQAASSGASLSNQESEGHARTVRVIPFLRVWAKREGFRRAGHVFGYLPRDIVLDSLTKDQIEQIKADPMLTCVEVEAAAE